MQKCRKKDPKWNQNGSPNRSKIGKRPKKGVRKFMPKKGAKKETQNSRPRVDFGPPGGLGGTGNYRLCFNPSLKRPASGGCGGFFMKNGPLAVEGSIVRTSWHVFGRIEKTTFFRCRSGGRKSRLKSTPGRPRVDFSATAGHRGVHFWPGGPRGRLARAYW